MRDVWRAKGIVVFVCSIGGSKVALILGNVGNKEMPKVQLRNDAVTSLSSPWYMDIGFTDRSVLSAFVCHNSLRTSAEP